MKSEKGDINGLSLSSITSSNSIPASYTTAADWISKIGRLLLGQIGKTEFVAGAVSSDVEMDRASHCEAWYYAGMKHLLAGDKKTAADCFDKRLGTQESTFDEYMLAQAELKSLETTN